MTKMVLLALFMISFIGCKDSNNLNGSNSITGTYTGIGHNETLNITLSGTKARIKCTLSKGSVEINGTYSPGGDYPHGKEYPSIDIPKEYGKDLVFRNDQVTFRNRRFKKVIKQSKTNKTKY